MLYQKTPLALAIILASCFSIVRAEGSIAQEVNGGPKSSTAIPESLQSARPEDLQEGMHLLDALSSSPLFAVVKIDQNAKLVTIATADGKDPDHGHQDGENDGYFTMPQAEFDLQTRLKEGVYVLKE